MQILVNIGQVHRNLVLIAYAQMLPLIAYAAVSSGARGLIFGLSLFQYFCERAVKALAKLYICTVPHEHSLLANALSSNILCADQYLVHCITTAHACLKNTLMPVGKIALLLSWRI